MSYTTWHTCGYGICVSDIALPSLDRLQSLLHMAPRYESSINQWLEECEITEPSVDDYLDFDQDFRLGLATLLQKVIEEAEGVCFTACDDFNSNQYLLYEPSYPWNLPAAERLLDEEGVAAIIRKYVSVITDAEITIDYDSVENGG